jgi:hypothetical protein
MKAWLAHRLATISGAIIQKVLKSFTAHLSNLCFLHSSVAGSNRPGSKRLTNVVEPHRDIPIIFGPIKSLDETKLNRAQLSQQTLRRRRRRIESHKMWQNDSTERSKIDATATPLGSRADYLLSFLGIVL